MRTNAFGIPLHDYARYDWKGNVVTEPSTLPRCRHCGDTINTSSPARADQQTEREIRLMLGQTTHVRSAGGPVPVDCWLEHGAFGRNYVRYEQRIDWLPSEGRLGMCLVERPYADDRSQGGVFGIWPLLQLEGI